MSLMERCKKEKKIQAGVIGIMALLAIFGSIAAIHPEPKMRALGFLGVVDTVIGAVAIFGISAVVRAKTERFKVVKTMVLIAASSVLALIAVGEAGLITGTFDEVMPFVQVLGIIAAVNTLGVAVLGFIWSWSEE